MVGLLDSTDVPGRVATGGTREEVEREMKDAIAFQLDGLKEEGMKLPEPRTSSSYVEVPVQIVLRVTASEKDLLAS